MIKKAIIITVLLGITCMGVSAQKITYGVKVSGGVAYQKVSNRDILSASSVKTFNIRGIAQMPLGKKYWLEGALGYVGKGSVVTFDALTTTTRLNYGELSFSALRKYTFTDLGVFYLGAGPYLAMGINGSLDYKTPGSDTEDKLKFGKENDIRQFDAGLNFTTGFEFRNRVTFNLGFALGLNNIASVPQQDSGTSVIKNREFLVGLGYLFK
jgi:hypothetical protein